MRCQTNEKFASDGVAKKNSVGNWFRIARRGGGRPLTNQGLSMENNPEEVLEKLDALADCQRALYNLMDPTTALQRDQRADVALLMEYLANEMARARRRLEAWARQR